MELDKFTDNSKLQAWQIEVLNKANQYKIKHNLNNINWYKLRDKIEKLELLISEAKEYGIFDWDPNDIIDLRQKIENAQFKATKEHNNLRNEYLSSIL